MAEKKIERKDWVSTFTLVGNPVITDFTFEIDKHSEKSDYVYNRMRLGIDCSEKHGTIWTEMMGGYSMDNPYPIRVFAKSDDGRGANTSNRLEIEWDDRKKNDIVEQVADMNLFTVGLEKTSDGKTYYKKFLSEYDAIEYIQKHLKADMKVKVRGTLNYSMYNGKTTIRKNLTSIVLDSEKNPSEPSATFTQSVLLDSDSVKLSKDYLDKDKGVLYVDGRVLDYLKEYNGVEIRGQFPYNVRFEFDISNYSEENIKKIYDKFLKVKKHVTQETFEGEFIESGATIQPTAADITDDIQELIDLGLWTQEDALKKMSTNGNTERRMVLKKPHFKIVGENNTPVVQKFEERYKEEQLFFDCMAKSDDEELPWEEGKSSNVDLDDWLNSMA